MKKLLLLFQIVINMFDTYCNLLDFIMSGFVYDVLKLPIFWLNVVLTLASICVLVIFFRDFLDRTYSLLEYLAVYIFIQKNELIRMKIT